MKAQTSATVFGLFVGAVVILQVMAPAAIAAAARLLGLAAASWGIISTLAAGQEGAAPMLGIAQGLLPLAAGFPVAAIAKVCDRLLARRAARLEQRLKAFAHEFSAIASRQIDANTR